MLNIASIVILFLALWFSLLNVIAIYNYGINAMVLGKEIIGTSRAKLPFTALEALVIVILWTAFYAVRVYA